MSGSGNAEYDRVRNWQLSQSHSAGSGGDNAPTDDGVAPVFNGDGSGNSYTPAVDEMYAAPKAQTSLSDPFGLPTGNDNGTLYSPLTDPTQIADIGDYDPSLQSDVPPDNGEDDPNAG